MSQETNVSCFSVYSSIFACETETDDECYNCTTKNILRYNLVLNPVLFTSKAW